MTEDGMDRRLKEIAAQFRTQLRSPIMSTPAAAGLEYEDITFPSEDGVPLEAWFIPRAGSGKLVISNHPKGFSRSGLPANLEPWASMFKPSGNDFNVDFIPDYRILHEAGYNVLTYDLRNFGHSGSGNGGIGTSGIFESRDVIGSLAYACSRDDTREMEIGLFSRCLGCNATMFALARRPEAFADVRCLVGVQPLSPGFYLEKNLAQLGIPLERMADLDEEIRLITSFHLDDLSPRRAAAKVTVPTMLYQVRDDVSTVPDDVQTIFDAMPAKEKELFWIEGTTRRWDGYTHFQQGPDRVLGWFARHMA